MSHRALSATILVIALLMLGCSKSDNSSTPTTQASGGGSSGAAAPAPGGKITIAVIPKGTTHIFWQSVRAGALRAAKEMGNVDINWNGPRSESERGQQIQIVDDMLTQGVNGIVLAPIDANALVDTINTAAKKVPVVIFDSGANTDTYKSFVATDNFKGGQLAGQRMVELLPDGGEIAIVRTAAGSESTTQREEGFKAEIKKNPKIQLVAEPYGDSDRNKSQRVAGDILAAHPNLKGFYGPNESSAFGILGALRDYKKKPGEIKFVGFDASDDLRAGLDEGMIDSLVLQNPVRMGHDAVIACAKAIRGQPVEKKQPIEPVLATQKNKDEPAVKELLNPKLD
jgi:ribose transport system substrate-binding protein